MFAQAKSNSVFQMAFSQQIEYQRVAMGWL
jgi:hypothetical protein